MGKREVTVILTCYNRKEKTAHCVSTLVEGNPSLHFSFIVVDDGSSDGTVDALGELHQKNDSFQLTILPGDGNLFWAGGMRKGMLKAKEEPETDYYLLVNDDVAFQDGCIEKMVQSAVGKVIVGATCDRNGKLTYSGVRYTGKGIENRRIGIEEADRTCDTFNANCVLLPGRVFLEQDVIDERYVHALGDFDYGLSLKKNGVRMEVYPEYVGVCEKNSDKGTWLDRSLSRRERIRKKESMKGAPTKQWFYFLKKNFGFIRACMYSITPYVRIAFGK